MANSIQYAKTQSTPSVKLNTNELAGRVRVAFAEYEASAEQSTITMFTIPNGARLLSAAVSHDALGGSTTLSVGYAAHTDADGTAVALDVDAYKAAASSATATSSVALSSWRLRLCSAEAISFLSVTISVARCSHLCEIESNWSRT